MTRTVLVVGATGILAPAAAALVAGGDAVLGVSRGGRAVPDGVVPLVADARDAAALRAVLSAHSVTDALVYAPAADAATLPLLRAAASGRLVLVQTSAAADPARAGEDAPAPLAETLQLGWATAADGSTRWHTPAEVSAAALAVLADGVPRTLGAVRPWSDRP